MLLLLAGGGAALVFSGGTDQNGDETLVRGGRSDLEEDRAAEFDEGPGLLLDLVESVSLLLLGPS
jgi:hypothetical protein